MAISLRKLISPLVVLIPMILYLTTGNVVQTSVPNFHVKDPSYVKMYPETWERLVEEMYEKVKGGEALNAFERGLLWKLYQLLEGAEFAHLKEKLQGLIKQIWDMQAEITGEPPYRPEKQHDEEE